jgi:flagellar motor component MotA
MKKGLLEKIFIGVCIGLVVMCAISAVDYGIKGQYRDMHNSLNWVLWIGNTIVMAVLLRNQGTEIEVKDNYIKSLETYKELADNHTVSLKELCQAQKDYSKGLEEKIEEYKGITEDYQKLIDQYKNAKPSRF